MSREIYEKMRKDIVASDLSEEIKNKLLNNLEGIFIARNYNILLVGGTGSGKSSTINALLDVPVAAVAAFEEPETKEIKKYELDNMVLWDTPGIGNNVEEDAKAVEAIKAKLQEKDEQGNWMIDSVLLVMDCASRDMGSAFELLTEVIVPNLGEERKNSILVGLNRCDVVKPRNWNCEENGPDEVLHQFLEEKAESVKTRIFESTGVVAEVVCYCAGETEDDEQTRPYNVGKLLAKMIEVKPQYNRSALAASVESTVTAQNIIPQKKESCIKRFFKRLFGC